MNIRDSLLLDPLLPKWDDWGQGGGSEEGQWSLNPKKERKFVIEAKKRTTFFLDFRARRQKGWRVGRGTQQLVMASVGLERGSSSSSNIGFAHFFLSSLENYYSMDARRAAPYERQHVTTT